MTKAWPLGLDGRRWWIAVLAYAALVAAVAPLDEVLSAWAHAAPAGIMEFFQWVTGFGDSAWILIPALLLFVVTALLAVLVRWSLMRLALAQLSALYGFVFLGVGLPGLVTNILKHLIGRGRPVHFAETGLWAFRPNWADWSYQSMPSGHTTTAFALAFTLGFFSRRFWLPLLVLAIGVGISRVVVGAHYPTDTLVGAGIGTLGAYVLRWVFAQRGWLFRRAADGTIRSRGTAAVTRLLQLRRRGIARARR
ncbi:MAG: phosphatase PAP2 family protein [Devosia sp.]